MWHNCDILPSQRWRHKTLQKTPSNKSGQATNNTALLKIQWSMSHVSSSRSADIKYWWEAAKPQSTSYSVHLKDWPGKSCENMPQSWIGQRRSYSMKTQRFFKRIKYILWWRWSVYVSNTCGAVVHYDASIQARETIFSVETERRNSCRRMSRQPVSIKRSGAHSTAPV